MNDVFNLEKFLLTVKHNKTVAKRTFLNFCSYVEEDVSVLKRLTTEDIEKIISMQKIGSIQHRNAIKINLMNILCWFQKHNIFSKDDIIRLSEVNWDGILIEATINRTYFRDLDDMLNYVGKVTVALGLTENDYLNYITLIILCYNSPECSIEEICNIKKADCNDNDFSVIIAGKKLKLKAKYYTYIAKYRDAITFCGNNHKEVKYIESEFLFRNSVSKKIDGTVVTRLMNILKTTIQTKTKLTKWFDLKDIQKVSLFNIINERLTVKNCKTFSDATSNLTRIQRCNYKEFFTLWKRVYG